MTENNNIQEENPELELASKYKNIDNIDFITGGVSAGLLALVNFIQQPTYDETIRGFQAYINDLFGNPTYLTSAPGIMFFTQISRILFLPMLENQVLKDIAAKSKLIDGIFSGIKRYNPEIMLSIFSIREAVQARNGFGYDDSFYLDLALGAVGYAIIRSVDFYK